MRHDQWRSGPGRARRQDGLLFEENGLVATITLNRPATKNSQTPATWHALRIIGSSLSQDVRVVVVRGAGDSFSSGLDRRMLSARGRRRRASACSPCSTCPTRRWPRASRPGRRASPGCAAATSSAIAAVRGAAVGAGFQLALACDLRVLADDARFSMREPLLGLVPDLTGTKPLVDLVGYSRALEICATTPVGRRRRGARDRAGDRGRRRRASSRTRSADLVAAAHRPAATARSRETKALLQSAARADLDEQRLAERRGPGPRFRELASLMGQ